MKKNERYKKNKKNLLYNIFRNHYIWYDYDDYKWLKLWHRFYWGGTSVQIKIGKMITVDEARKIVDEYDKEASIVHIGANKDEIMIRSKKDFTNDEINQIIDKFAKEYDIEEKEFQSEKFGPFMGKEIKKKSFVIFVYCCYRHVNLY